MVTLPVPFDDLDRAGANIDGRRRYIGWLFLDERTIARNTCTWAHVTVEEMEPMRGEPLRLLASRRTPGDTHRGPFTDAGRERLRSALLPPIARYGFDRLWSELRHRAAVKGPAVSRAPAMRARAHADWLDRQADLAEMYELGIVDLRAARAMTKRPPVLRGPMHDGWTDETAIAAAMVDGQQVGWLTSRNVLVPLDVRA